MGLGDSQTLTPPSVKTHNASGCTNDAAGQDLRVQHCGHERENHKAALPGEDTVAHLAGQDVPARVAAVFLLCFLLWNLKEEDETAAS